MASLRTPTAVIDGGQSIVKVFTIDAVVTGDTFTVPVGTKAAFAVNTSSADALYSTLSAGVLTIVVANTPNVAIWCLLA